MPYSAIPDRAIPYHIDGSVVVFMSTTLGVLKTFSAAEMLEINDINFTAVNWGSSVLNYPGNVVVFFPELRDISAIFSVLQSIATSGAIQAQSMTNLQGSADTTNGVDGTWVDATMTAGYPPNTLLLDDWRKGLKTFTGLAGVKAIRFAANITGSGFYSDGLCVLHIYGHKTAGQTPNDILFLDAEDADAEFSSPLDFGDRPAGTSVIRQIKVRNSSATLTASNLVVTVVDPVDNIRVSDAVGGPWTTSKTFASLAPATSSSIIYVKCETLAPPTPLGPMRAPIKAVVGAWT